MFLTPTQTGQTAEAQVRFYHVSEQHEERGGIRMGILQMAALKSELAWKLRGVQIETNLVANTHVPSLLLPLLLLPYCYYYLCYAYEYDAEYGSDY